MIVVDISSPPSEGVWAFSFIIISKRSLQQLFGLVNFPVKNAWI